MSCHESRRLFPAYWDDEITQAEREWLEAHFASCSRCRTRYEDYARVMEAVSTLPRIETAPDLVERTLARARRASPARDMLPERRNAWVPATAAAALLLITAAVLSQWLGLRRHDDRVALSRPPVATATTEPVATRGPSHELSGPSTPNAALSGAAGSVSDSLFDHAEDVEFVLDPVTMRHGRASVSRSMPQGIRTERAVVSF